MIRNIFVISFGFVFALVFLCDALSLWSRCQSALSLAALWQNVANLAALVATNISLPWSAGCPVSASLPSGCLGRARWQDWFQLRATTVALWLIGEVLPTESQLLINRTAFPYGRPGGRTATYHIFAPRFIWVRSLYSLKLFQINCPSYFQGNKIYCATLATSKGLMLQSYHKDHMLATTGKSPHMHLGYEWFQMPLHKGS